MTKETAEWLLDAIEDENIPEPLRIGLKRLAYELLVDGMQPMMITHTGAPWTIPYFDRTVTCGDQNWPGDTTYFMGSNTDLQKRLHPNV